MMSISIIFVPNMSPSLPSARCRPQGPSLPQSPPHARCCFCKRSYYSEEVRKSTFKHTDSRNQTKNSKNPFRMWWGDIWFLHLFVMVVIWSICFHDFLMHTYIYIHITTSHYDSKCRPFCWFLSPLNRNFKIQFHGWKFPMARLPRLTCSSGFDWTHEQQAPALRYLSLSSMWIWQVPFCVGILDKCVRHIDTHFSSMKGSKFFSTEGRVFPRWTARPQKRILPGLWPPLHALWGEGERILLVLVGGSCCETMKHYILCSKASNVWDWTQISPCDLIWFDPKHCLYLYIYRCLQVMYYNVL